jgi:hypothetical protein
LFLPEDSEPAPTASKKVLEADELEDRMVALNFQREGPRRQPPQREHDSHENGVDIYTVRYDDEGDGNDGERRREVGNVWSKLKRVGKRATALEALRRR